MYTRFSAVIYLIIVKFVVPNLCYFNTFFQVESPECRRSTKGKKVSVKCFHSPVCKVNEEKLRKSLLGRVES